MKQSESFQMRIRYWNYLRKQTFILESYTTKVNWIMNRALFTSHCYLSWGFVAPYIMAGIHVAAALRYYLKGYSLEDTVITCSDDFEVEDPGEKQKANSMVAALNKQNLTNIFQPLKAEPWQLGSQDAATPIMQGITDLHHDVFFIVILILVFVSCILGRALWHFHYKKNPRTTGTVLSAVMALFGAVSLQLRQTCKF